MDVQRLPPAFCKSLNEVISEQAILTTCKGTWTVEIARGSNNMTCFQKGWDKFVQCHGLNIGNFAVFEHLGIMHFNVSVFDSTTCEKEFSLDDEEDETFGLNVYEIGNQSKRGRPRKTSTSSQQESLQFVRKIMPYNISHHSSCMYIPRSIWQPNKLLKKTSIHLRGPSGKLHEVKLTIHRKDTLSMTSGWHDFCVSNSLKDEDICLFQLNQTTVGSKAVTMDVQIFPAPS